MITGKCMRWRAALLASLPAALALCGCGGMTAQQQGWLKEGREAYDARYYRQAVERLSLFLQQVDQGPEAAQAYYLRGSARLHMGDFGAGLVDLRNCINLDADTDATWRAYTSVGMLRYEDGAWAEARDALAAAVARMPRNAESRPLVLFRQAACCERTGRWGEARRLFAQIVSEHGDSAAAEGARRRLALGADHFAVQCGVFADPGNADRMMADLRRKGFDTYRREEPRGRSMVHVVLFGRFDNYTEMLRQLGAVRREIPGAVPWP
jgi:tetratricopeptide (TPR) repeat protein